MKRLLNIALTALAMLLVAALAALLSLRVAIHGREVAVPALSGLSDQDAALATRRLGLNLSVENRFFSASIPPNHVLSQAPPPGERVRRGWQVRVTESLGAQHVAAPDLTGQSERPAALMLNHLQLTLAPDAHLPTAGVDGVVVAQSPEPNSRSATEPRVALLVTEALPDPDEAPAFVMPRLTGLSVRSATTLLAGAGLHLGSITSLDPTPGGSVATSDADFSLGSLANSTGERTAGSGAASVPHTPGEGAAETARTAPFAHLEAAVGLTDVIIEQSPAPGSRITASDEIYITAAPKNTPAAEGAAAR